MNLIEHVKKLSEYNVGVVPCITMVDFGDEELSLEYTKLTKAEMEEKLNDDLVDKVWVYNKCYEHSKRARRDKKSFRFSSRAPEVFVLQKDGSVLHFESDCNI